MRIDVDPIAVDSDDTPFIAEKRPLQRDFLFLCFNLNGNEIGKIRRFLIFDFADRDPSFLRQTWSVDVVDVRLEDRVKKPLDDRRRQELRADVGDIARVLNLNGTNCTVGQCPGHAAKPFRQIEERLNDIHDLRGNRRHIDRRHDRFALESGAYSFGDVDGNADLRFDGRGPEMRRQDDAGKTDQRMIRRNRFRRVNVDRRAGDNPRFHGVGEILLVNNTAAGAIHKADALLHLCQIILVEHISRFRRQRHVNGNKVAPLDNLLQRHQLYAHHRSAFLRYIGIVTDNVHIEGLRPLRYSGADAPQPDDAQRLAPQFNADVFLAVPLALLRRFVSDGDVTRHCQHHAHRVFRRRDRIAAGGIDDDNAAGRGRVNVDIVDADSRPADDFQLFTGVQHFLRHLRRGADDQRVVSADRRQKLLCRQLIFHINGKSGFP